jgi:uncharacterized protein (TIGR02186 family)
MMVRFLICLLLLSASPSGAQELAVEIASNHIDITVGFTGSRIDVFGDKRDSDTDVAVFVIGPEKTITVWEKAPVLGAWINRHYAHFKRQPGYYNYATSFVDDELVANQQMMLENRIGVEALFEKADMKFSGDPQDKQKFIDALVAQKRKTGIYPEKPAEMKFLNENFFRAGFNIPAGAPIGEYKIHSFLIKKGVVVEADIDVLKVEQVGLNAFILLVAKRYEMLYSLFCIMVAAFAGWFVSAIRVRP